MKFLCEVCGEKATHSCGGLDVPELRFCPEHAKEHEEHCPDVQRGASQMIEVPQ